MTTHLYLHAAAGITEEDFACWFGHDFTSKWRKLGRTRCTEGRPDGPLPWELWFCVHYKRVGESPRLYIDDDSNGFSALAKEVMKLVPRDEFPILDGALRERLMKAMQPDEWDDETVPWLDAHMGEPLFYIIW